MPQLSEFGRGRERNLKIGQTERTSPLSRVSLVYEIPRAECLDLEEVERASQFLLHQPLTNHPTRLHRTLVSTIHDSSKPTPHSPKVSAPRCFQVHHSNHTNYKNTTNRSQSSRRIAMEALLASPGTGWLFVLAKCFIEHSEAKRSDRKKEDDTRYTHKPGRTHNL